jgi:hypothetical protein
MEKDLAVYVLVRNDLPSMNPGKAMAQVHHAGVQLMGKYHTDRLARWYLEYGVENDADHFNTTIVLSANLTQIENALNIAQMFDNVLCDSILDPSYPFFVDTEIADFVEKDPAVTRVNTNLFTRPEVTCGWILMDRNNPVLKSIVAALPLHS